LQERLDGPFAPDSIRQAYTPSFSALSLLSSSGFFRSLSMKTRRVRSVLALKRKAARRLFSEKCRRDADNFPGQIISNRTQFTAVGDISSGWPDAPKAAIAPHTHLRKSLSENPLCARLRFHIMTRINRGSRESCAGPNPIASTTVIHPGQAFVPV